MPDTHLQISLSPADTESRFNTLRELLNVCQWQMKFLQEQLRDRLAPRPEDAVRDLYHELIYAVARAYPGESRHQTALRYIRQAEELGSAGPVQAAAPTYPGKPQSRDEEASLAKSLSACEVRDCEIRGAPLPKPLSVYES
jgi:hypothetical protein